MGEAKTAHGCGTCRYQGFSSGECPCSGCDGMGFDRWLPNETTEIDALKAELAKVTEELATAQEHIGQPLRLRVTLTKERDAARGDAEALAVALGKIASELPRLELNYPVGMHPDPSGTAESLVDIAIEALANRESR